MPANLTILISAKFIGKRFDLVDGKIAKQSKTTLSRGDAISAYAPDAESLRAIIEGLEHGENLCMGVMRDGRDTAKIVTSERYAKLKDPRDRIARTLDHFAHPDGPGWLVIDFDDAGMPDTVAQRLEALGGVEGALGRIWPEIADADMLVRASSSSGVYSEGIDPKTSTGVHVYVLIRDPENSSAALDALHRRAWAEGLGWIRPSAHGKALVRSIVDVAVGSPERIVFEAPPLLGEGVMRIAQPIRIQAGQALAAPLGAPDVDALIEAEKDRMRPALDAIKAQYIRQRGKAVAAKKKITVAEGEKIVRAYLAQDGGKIDVPGAMLVYDRSGALVTANALVASVKPGDRFGLPDPSEGPSYGRTTATLMWGLKYDAPIIVSHAHGMKTIYHLPEPPSKAIWKIKPAKIKNRRQETLVDVLSKVKGLDDLDKVLAVAVAQSNKAPHVMSGRDVMTFLHDHLPDGVIAEDWIKAIEGRIRWSLAKRRLQALAPTHFSADMLSKPWIDHQVVDELSPLDDIDGVTLVRAPMASGKTQKVGAPWIRDVKAALKFGDEVWAIAHRVSLIGEMTHRLDLAHYQKDGYQKTLEKGGVGICSPSIAGEKYSKEQPPEYVFVDEIRQVLEFFGAESYCRTKKGSAADVFDRLVTIVRNAKGVLCADAGADDTVLRFLRMCRPDDQIKVVEMRSKPTDIKGRFVTGAHCQDDVIAQAAFAMQIGLKVWFACEGTDTAEAVGHELGNFGKILVITADNKNDEAQKAFLDDPEGQSRLYEAVIASPIISSGISIEHRDKPHFNAGFALFSGGAIRPTDAAQILRRVRYLTDWTIGLTSLNRFGGCRAEDIIEGKIAAADLEGLRIDAGDFDRMVMGFEAEAHNLRGDFGAGLWWLLHDARWTLTREHADGFGGLVATKKAVVATRDQQVIKASRWLETAVARWGEALVVNTIDNARRNAPAPRTRRRIEAWQFMDLIGLRTLTQEDIDWLRGGGRAQVERYTDLTCRYEPIEVVQVTLAHRALRLARRKHYIAMLGEWDPLADDAVLSEEVAEQALDVIWPRRKEFAASVAVPETWRNMKNKPKNARAAMRNVLLRCGLWFERKRCTESHFQNSESNGLEKSGTRNLSTTRPWKWTQHQTNLAQAQSRYHQYQYRNAERQRAFLIASEQTDQTKITPRHSRIVTIEGRKRTDSAVSEIDNRLKYISEALGYRPQFTVREVETSVFVAGQPPVSVMAEALRRRGWQVNLE